MPLKAKVRALCARSAPPTMAFHAIEKCSGAVRSGWALALRRSGRAPEGIQKSCSDTRSVLRLTPRMSTLARQHSRGCSCSIYPMLDSTARRNLAQAMKTFFPLESWSMLGNQLMAVEHLSCDPALTGGIAGSGVNQQPFFDRLLGGSHCASCRQRGSIPCQNHSNLMAVGVG